MADDIEKIFQTSAKAELIERLSDELQTANKAVVVIIEDKEDGKYNSLVMTLGLEYTYEAYGILEIAKQDLEAEE